MDKYVLCRPESGINDMLCQIGLCFRYCLTFDRVLVIDTANTAIFAEDFGRYFTLHHPKLRHEPDAKAFLALVETRKLSLFPAPARLRRYDEANADDRPRSLHWDVLSFDMATDHEADVLVHHKSGGGRPDWEFLRSLRLTDDFARAMAARWRAMPKPYEGVHIRNTDYKSDPAVIAAIIGQCHAPVYLATDSADAQRRILATGRRDFTTSPIPDFGGSPIHRTPVSSEEKSRLNRLALEDLIMLALSRKVHASCPISGFSDLAKRLNARQSLVVGWFRKEHVGAGLLLRLHANRLRNLLLKALRR